ncbi:MAG: sigma-70 family RNA polymerase sigma factor [Clostridia bacterium]|nr:sigma-70 family RNA polymerase sigma factor [Clostridia bacterium]
MAVIKYRFWDGHHEEIEVTEEFAVAYAEMERSEHLTERKETRRHQSLDKSLEHGFDIADPHENIAERIERRELSEEIRKALHKLTDKQRIVFLLYVVDELNYREIGEKLGLGTYTVRDYFYNAVKKLKNILQ